MLRGTARPWATLLTLVAMLCTGLIAPTTAGAQTSPGMDQILPAGDDNVLYLSQLRTAFDPVAPGATISVDAPIGISFANASVTATDDSRPGEPARGLATTVSAGGRSIEWTVPGDIPSGTGLLFELTGAQSPGYTAWKFDDTFSLGLDVGAGGASRDVNSLGLGGAFFLSAPRFFYGGAPVTWRLPAPSSSVALEQLMAGTGGEARFGSLSGAFIPAAEADEELPVSASADGQRLTVTMPNRSETFTLVIDTGAEEPPRNDLHALIFVAESVTVEQNVCGPSDQVIGAIRDRYISLDGPCGLLGDPLTSELATPVKFGRFNHFEGGSIYWSPATGAWEVHGAIRETWSRLGWENSALGFPVTNELAASRQGAYSQFQGGSIYWSPSTGAHEVRGGIRETWSRLGWERSALGFPLTNETPTPHRPGAFNHFEAGSIYWSPSTGAREVRGAIRQSWSRLGWENGALGFPVTDEAPTSAKFGAFNHFQGGSVYWSPSTGAFEVRGAIRARWAAMGWENSSLGFPTSDEYGIPGGRRSDFQGGSITWTPSGGTVVSAR